MVHFACAARFHHQAGGGAQALADQVLVDGRQRQQRPGDPARDVGRADAGIAPVLRQRAFPQQGIEVRFADPRDPASFAKLIDARTKAVFCESIGNPLWGNARRSFAASEVPRRAISGRRSG